MHEHLVAYEYGSGIMWGLVKASSPDQVRERIPEVEVHVAPPAWMTSEDLAELRRHSLIELSAGACLEALFDGHRARLHDLAS